MEEHEILGPLPYWTNLSNLQPKTYNRNSKNSIVGCCVDAIYIKCHDEDAVNNLERFAVYKGKYAHQISDEFKHPNNTPMYQIEEYKNNTKYNEVSKQYEKINHTAPSCPMRVIRNEPRVSVHKSGHVSNEKISDIDVPWLIDPSCIYKRVWEIITEEEGLGRQGNQLCVSYGRK